MRHAYLSGLGLTRFGRHEDSDTLDLMSEAAQMALSDAGIDRDRIDGVVTGYSTALPHLMLATLFCEHFGLQPTYANALQLGGATGAALVMQARLLVQAGQCDTVLVCAGENRLTNDGGRDDAIRTLAQVGHAEYEVPYGAMIPGYYALLASHYLARYEQHEEDLAEVAVHMRSQARQTDGAHLSDPLDIASAMGSRPISTPLKLADCCPISDGAAALVVSAAPGAHRPVRIEGAGQAHMHQHVSGADIGNFGAGAAADRAFAEAGIPRDRVGALGIYDSFTVTLAILLEETGFAPPGGTAAQLREGRHAPGGPLPLNMHGGLLSYGHPGVAGGMAHLVEVTRRMRSRGARTPGAPIDYGYVHADGGVLSSHVGLVLAGE